MKLKKIASLALAGVMAFSMLTACGNTINEPEQPTQPEQPVDTSFAAAVNDEMSGAHMAVLTFESDATLQSTLNKVAGQLDSRTLTTALTKNGFVFGDDAGDFRHLLGIGRTNSLTTGVNGGEYDPFLTAAYASYKFFSTKATSKNTVADLIVVPGNLTEEGLAEVVAANAEKLIDYKRMPNDGVYDGKEYKYDYTGDIAYTKVDNLSGDFSAYVVAITVTQTPTQITNRQ